MLCESKTNVNTSIKTVLIITRKGFNKNNINLKILENI